MSTVARRLGGRVAQVVATMLAATLAIFAALYLTPGGPLASLVGGRTVTAAQLAEVKSRYHLDESFSARYASWLGDLVHGRLGESLVFHDDVAVLIGPRIGTTFLLVAYASILIIVLGLLVGVVAELRGRRFRGLLLSLTTVGLATPAFVAAIVLISVFAVGLGWFPAGGDGDGLADDIYHLTLPACALAMGGAASVARITNASVRAELSREHVETARSRGLRETQVVRRHVVRNALMPIVTASGLTIASLIAGAVVVETAFGIGGLGSLFVSSVQAKDYAVVQAIAVILVAAFLIINMLVDGLYVLIDPRVRTGATSR